MNQNFFGPLLLSIVLIIANLLAIYNGGGIYRGYAVPLWGCFITLAIGIIMLIMIIRHWCKQKKNQVLNNSDENAEAEAAQENLLADDAQQPLEDKNKNQP